jgi:hypothetical protein
MEALLALYRRPYDADYPVVCFDERPCVLHGEVVAPLPMQPGKPQRADYEYQRQGTCCLLVAFEPLTGHRIVEVSKQRRASDYTRFMQRVAAHYRERIELVQDNLNTHTAGSFYKNLPAEAALALSQRLGFHYTPKKASWLNMAEIEISVLVRQCLDRRIESQQRLAREMGQLVKERNVARARVTWQFTPQAAREKLKRHYQKVYCKN